MADILVTDDDEELRNIVRAALESAGHSVAEAEDGAEALRYLERHRVDVLITDMHMPDLDGLGLARALRAMKHPAGIVGMSGHDFADVLKMAGMLGARATLTKPFSAQQLLAAVAQALGPAA